jgi:hypothetical protein
MKMDRRRFLVTTAATAVSIRTLAQSPAPATATLTLHPDQPGPTIPANFVGLSYETQQLSDPAFFSPKNTGLIAQFRALAPHGVLRIGGNTSDVGWWKPTPTSKQPPLPAKVVIVPLRPDERPFQDLAYSVTPEAVRNLRAFLDATGWTCLYGINLGTSTPERAAEEAEFVSKTLGPKLEYFQVGNEPDLFDRRFREKAKWNADAYLDEWLAFADAIRGRVAHVRFGLPDTSGNPQWSTVISDRLAAMRVSTCPCDLDPTAPCSCIVALNAPRVRPTIAAISHHYYFTGPPSNPKANFTDLLQPDLKVQRTADTVRAAALKLNRGAEPFAALTQYRMTEGNTCYRGGKPGFSDVFGAALWAADYLLTLASLGYAGVNLHGGSGKAVADSLGGTLPGELLMPDPKAPHARPFYTPIAEINSKYIAEPVFYGLQFAQLFAGATIIPIDFNPGTVNATAFAAKLPTGQTVIAIINKDETHDLHIDVPFFSTSTTLTAPSLTSTQAALTEPTRFRETSTVPRASAVLLASVRE